MKRRKLSMGRRIKTVMTVQAKKLIWTVPIVLLAFAGTATFAADKEKDKGKEEKVKTKKDDKLKSEPRTPADLFKPTPEFEAKEQKARNIGEQIEAEVAARAVPIPAEMSLDVDWYSPHLDAAKV